MNRKIIFVSILYTCCLFLSACSGSESENADIDASTVGIPPTGLSVLSDDGSITLSWEPVPDAQSYNVYWSVSPPMSVEAYDGFQNVSETTFDHIGLANGTIFFYVVTSICSTGESAASETVSAAPYQDAVVNFPDSNFEARIRQEHHLNLPDGEIHISDLQHLTTLHLGNAGINSIEGIEYCYNITFLSFSPGLLQPMMIRHDNHITDLSPIHGLTKLTELILVGDDFDDISPIENLTNLASLSLSGDGITDISPLQHITNLTVLSLDGNGIADISPLEHLTNLTELRIGGTQVTDINSIKNLIFLTWLEFYRTPISDITPLQNLLDLKVLRLEYGEINNISSLADLIHLESLALNHNHIADITALENLSSLGNLELNGNLITDISSLQNLTNLNVLNLNDNQITDISPIEGLPNLMGLQLYNNPLNAASCFSIIPALEAGEVLVSHDCSF